MARNTLPRIRFHKASGKATLVLSGKTFYLDSSYGTAAAQAEGDRLVAEWLANGRRIVVAPSLKPSARSIMELVAAYNQFAKSYYRKDGKVTSSMFRVRVVAKLLKKLYGRQLVTEFGPLKLRALQQNLVVAKKSRRYINHITEQVKRVFKWGVSMELVPADVLQALITVPGLRKDRSEAVETAPIRPLADDHVERTLPYLSAIVADVVRPQRLTGCRPGEVCLIRSCDVDASGEVWIYIPHAHKTEHHGKQRTILIGPKALDLQMAAGEAKELAINLPGHSSFDDVNFRVDAYGLYPAKQ